MSKRPVVKWDNISDYEKQKVFDLIEEYQDPLFNGRLKGERNDLLKEIFKAYNKYVGGKYTLSNRTCASCVKNVTQFFITEYAKQKRTS